MQSGRHLNTPVIVINGSGRCSDLVSTRVCSLKVSRMLSNGSFLLSQIAFAFTHYQYVEAVAKDQVEIQLVKFKGAAHTAGGNFDEDELDIDCAEAPARALQEMWEGIADSVSEADIDVHKSIEAKRQQIRKSQTDPRSAVWRRELRELERTPSPAVQRFFVKTFGVH